MSTVWKGLCLSRSSITLPLAQVIPPNFRRSIGTWRRTYQTPSMTLDKIETVHPEKALRRESRISGLHRMPTSSILRNLMLGACFRSPIFFKLAFSFMNKIAHSSSPLLNPDRNLLLRALVKPFIYDQFCAGTTQPEIQQTRRKIKTMGYSGIILCYGKETEVPASQDVLVDSTNTQARDIEIDAWRDGNLETLDMVGEGDWLGIKLTGAGSVVTEALMREQDPPESFVRAIDAICQKAQSQNCRLWIDAEQQKFQKGIDTWTIDLMRRYNGGAKALVYNTIQAYLKKSRSKLKHQLSLADKEEWTLAIKLVRGAYIGNDQRQLIHDTKADTDECYNDIVRDLLTGCNLGFSSEHFPRVQLFLAGHNPVSIAKASHLISELGLRQQLKVVPDFGQLQGMADEVGCNLLQYCEDLEKSGRSTVGQAIVPKVYKCLTWGTIQECMQYLVRRVVENSSGTDRMKDGMAAYSKELRNRVLGN